MLDSPHDASAVAAAAGSTESLPLRSLVPKNFSIETGDVVKEPTLPGHRPPKPLVRVVIMPIAAGISVTKSHHRAATTPLQFSRASDPPGSRHPIPITATEDT